MRRQVSISSLQPGETTNTTGRRVGRSAAIMGLIRVFYSPEEVLADLPPRGSWIAPFIAALLIALGMSVTLTNVVGVQTIIRNTLYANPRAVRQLGDEKIREMAREAAESNKEALIMHSATVFGTALLIVAASGVLFAALLAIDSAADFGRVFAVCCYSRLVYEVANTAVSIAVLMLVSDYEGLDFGSLGGLNPSLFLDRETTPKLVYTVASSIDAFTIWALFVAALGLSKTADNLRLSRAAVAVFGLWSIYVVAKTGLTSIF